MIELAARSIGGLCGRTLRFGAGVALEEVVLRHALGLPLEGGCAGRTAAAGVMMLPIPRAGKLHEVAGRDEARAVPGVSDIARHNRPRRTAVVPCPRGIGTSGHVRARPDAG